MSDHFTVEQIAIVCHNANRGLQSVLDEKPSPEWGELTDDIKDSGIQGVLKAIKGDTPRELHESWCAHRRANGWTYGMVKDIHLKTHPCLVDYSKLPPAQRLKDELFSKIVELLKPRDTPAEAFYRGVHGG